MNYDWEVQSGDEEYAAAMLRTWETIGGITDNMSEGDLMFIQLKSKRRFSVYRLAVEKGRKVFKRVPRRLWDRKIQAEVAMKVMYLGKQ